MLQTADRIVEESEYTCHRQISGTKICTFYITGSSLIGSTDNKHEMINDSQSEKSLIGEQFCNQIMYITVIISGEFVADWLSSATSAETKFWQPQISDERQVETDVTQCLIT